MATPDTIIAEPHHVHHQPCQGRAGQDHDPLNAVRIPKAGASSLTPTRLTRAEGMADTQIPVKNPNMQDRVRKIQ